MDAKEIIQEYFKELDKREAIREKKEAEKAAKARAKQKREMIIKSIFNIVTGGMILYTLKMIFDILAFAY